MTAPEPGWYRDPSDPRRHRFWDGEEWVSECQRLRDGGQVARCPGDED